MKAKYINPFTDFGFKKIFGEDASKPILIDFLTSLLPNSNIVDLTFKDKEKLGSNKNDRKAIYDIYCEDNNGEKIIVELQKAKQNYFKDRTVFYATFPIQEQAEIGEWNYELKAVYCIGILDFKFDDNILNKDIEVIHTIELKDQKNQIFYDKLKFIYLEMPNFNKSEMELITPIDKWLYFIKNLEDFQNIPEIFKNTIFSEAFEKAEIAKFDEAEREEYEESLKTFRDNKAVFEYAKSASFDNGVDMGKLSEKTAIVLLMNKEGEPIEKIIKYTGLTKEKIVEILS